MLTELCAEIRNYFCRDEDKHLGTFEISGGNIAPLDYLKDGQYYRIVGSTYNDGVHQFPSADLVDEKFEGAVWAMAVPPSVVALADEIKAYSESEESKPSAFTSESFGGYSYTRATGPNGSPLTWQDVFAKKLKAWRKI